MVRDIRWKQPALLEVWQHPDKTELIVWRTRRRGFKYEISFESTEKCAIELDDSPFTRGEHKAVLYPTLVCTKRKELDAAAEQYVKTLTNNGYHRVYSCN